MNIKDFKYIVAVVDCGSYSKAADMLFLSQPSLSTYVRNLEKQLDIRFFESNKKELTPEGQLYVSFARRIIALDEELMQNLKQMKRAKDNNILIGMTTGRSEAFLDYLYDYFNKAKGGPSVEFCVDNSQNLIQKTFASKLDFILLNKSQASNGLITHTIFTDHLLLALHKSNPVCKFAYSVPNDKYRHLPMNVIYNLSYIVFPKGRSLRSIFDYFFESVHKIPHIIQEVLSVRSACKLISHGTGATLLFDNPSEIDYLGNNCECFFVDSDHLNIDYVIAYDKNMILTKEHQKTMQAVKKIINKYR